MASVRVEWTRDQLVKVLSLYCQLPFGRMHARNVAVIGLAKAIGRTPAAVALKLVNFASMDPDLKERGVRGMQNSSVADRSVWQEFYGRWDTLAQNAIVEVVPNEDFRSIAQKLSATRAPVGPTEVVRESKQRRGQQFFRSAVLAAHDCKCCLTGITSEPLLRASHIVPWSSDLGLRLNPQNGLCLNALHDAAFDRGLITFTEKFELRLSKKLRKEVPTAIYVEMFECRAGKPIVMPIRHCPTQEMIEYHRCRVFQN